MEKIIGNLYYNGMFAFYSMLWCGSVQYSAFCGLMEAIKTFRSWRTRNPGVYIGLSDEGSLLVRHWITAYDHFYTVHPWLIMDHEERQQILNLLDELPPKSPKSMPVLERHPGALSFLCGILRTMQEHAYGIIPFYEGEKGREVFLIHQYGSGGDMLWTFPKGRPDQGESALETAERECKEEANITPHTVIEGHPLSTSYTFDRKGERIEKTSTYYIGLCTAKDFTVQPEEVKEAGWFTVAEARDRLTFPDYKKLLDEAVQILDNLS